MNGAERSDTDGFVGVSRRKRRCVSTASAAVLACLFAAAYIATLEYRPVGE